MPERYVRSRRHLHLDHLRVRFSPHCHDLRDTRLPRDDGCNTSNAQKQPQQQREQHTNISDLDCEFKDVRPTRHAIGHFFPANLLEEETKSNTIKVQIHQEHKDTATQNKQKKTKARIGRLI